MSEGSITTKKDFKKTPAGQYKYWKEEVDASELKLHNWKKAGVKITNRYINAKGHTDILAETSVDNNGKGFRLNLFHSNVLTLDSMLYGNLPTVDVSRRYADPADDVGRVAGEMLERVLNNDIADNGKEIDCVLRSTLQDRLLSGLGCAKVRYVAEYDGDELIFEDAPLEYYHWQDVIWGWGRTFAELPWIGFKSFLTRDEVEERFGKEAAEGVEIKSQKASGDSESVDEKGQDDNWMKAEIIEIWDKSKRQVVWISAGYDKVLETKDDPLKLNQFFPCPPFFLANPTTTMYKPTPDFLLAQDLYNEVDTLQTRISTITEAVKVVGVYNASEEASVGRMLKEGIENDMIPVENWALFGEQGGLKGVVDFFPVEDITKVLNNLVTLRDQTIQLLQQTTGMADVMRGELTNQYEGVGQTNAKTKFGSVRIQRLQDEFATFAGDMFQLKAEIICKHYDRKTILERSGMQYSPDANIPQPAPPPPQPQQPGQPPQEPPPQPSQTDEQLIPQALELLKDFKQARMRVVIRPESVAMVDFAELQSERTAFLTAIATYLQSAQPIMEADPNAKPYVLSMLQWGLAGFKGASEIEGVLDRAISASQEESQQPEKPDPAAALEQAKQQAALAVIQAKQQADAMTREQDMKADIQTAQMQHQLDMAKLTAETQAQIAEIQAKLEADLLVEKAQVQANIMQTQAGAQAEMQKDSVTTQLALQQKAMETTFKIEEIKAKSTAEIKKATLQVNKSQEKPDAD